MGSSKAIRGIKPITSKNFSKVERSSHDSDLPFMSELKGFSSPEREETRLQIAENLKESSKAVAKVPQADSSSSMRLLSVRNRGIHKGVDSFEKYGEESVSGRELNDNSGIEKFRNKTQIVNDFDEKGIFQKRKELASPHDPLELTQEGFVSQTKNLPTPSSSSYFQSAPTKNKDEDVVHSPNPEDEDEIDELDEDWDMKIFEGYLPPNHEVVDAAHTSPHFSKRNIEQLRGKQQHSSPKRPKVDLIRAESLVNDTLQYVNEDRSTLERENVKIGVDEAIQSGSLKDLPIGKLHPKDTDSQEQGEHNFDFEDESDPLMAMVDEVMAWAELHVNEQ